MARQAAALPLSIHDHGHESRGVWRAGLVLNLSISQRSEGAALGFLDLTSAATMQPASPTSGFSLPYLVEERVALLMGLTSWLPDEGRVEFCGALIAGREAGTGGSKLREVHEDGHLPLCVARV